MISSTQDTSVASLWRTMSLRETMSLRGTTLFFFAFASFDISLFNQFEKSAQTTYYQQQKWRRTMNITKLSLALSLGKYAMHVIVWFRSILLVDRSTSPSSRKMAVSCRRWEPQIVLSHARLSSLWMLPPVRDHLRCGRCSIRYSSRGE